MIELHEPPAAGDERELLGAFIDFQRAVILRKTEGLSEEDAAKTTGASTLTLAGMLHHLTFVEDFWFTYILLGADAREPWRSAPWSEDDDWDWRTAHEHSLAELRQWYSEAIHRSNDVVASFASLDALAVRERDGEQVSLRWILLHLLEETARHAGHADLIRESIDGATGD